MKTIRSIFQTHGVFAAILTTGAPIIVAQTVDLSTGTVLDSSTSRSVAPIENPAPTKLTVSIQPIEKGIETSGDSIFVMVGSAVSVVGRIVGLEPNKRYQAVVWVPSTPVVSRMSTAGTVVNPSSEARPPAAESPPTGSPAPATPTNSQGGAGTASPANSTTLTTPSLQSIELDLGTMVSDARGTANLNSTIPGKNLSAPPTGILGCSVVIKRATPLDSQDERNPVASGVIVVSGAVAPVAP